MAWLRHSQPRFRPSSFVGQSEFAELHAKAWNAPWQNLRVQGFYHQSSPLSHIWGPQPDHFGVGVGEKEFVSLHLSAGSSSAGWATFYVKPSPTPMSLLDHTCSFLLLVCPKPSLLVRNPDLITGNWNVTPSLIQMHLACSTCRYYHAKWYNVTEQHGRYLVGVEGDAAIAQLRECCDTKLTK